MRGQLPPSVTPPSPAVSLAACTTPSPRPGTSCHPLLGPQLQPVLGALEGLLASFRGPLLQPHQHRPLTGAQGGVWPDHRGERLSWSTGCSEALGMFVPATSVAWLEVSLASPVGPAGPLPTAAHPSHRLCPASVWCWGPVGGAGGPWAPLTPCGVSVEVRVPSFWGLAVADVFSRGGLPGPQSAAPVRCEHGIHGSLLSEAQAHQCCRQHRTGGGISEILASWGE